MTGAGAGSQRREEGGGERTVPVGPQGLHLGDVFRLPRQHVHERSCEKPSLLFRQPVRSGCGSSCLCLLVELGARESWLWSVVHDSLGYGVYGYESMRVLVMEFMGMRVLVREFMGMIA